MAHICNPSYSRGSDQEDQDLGPVWVISTNKLDVVVHACYPSSLGSINRRMTVQDNPGKNGRPYLKNK
jgi:hypothetical protein